MIHLHQIDPIALQFPEFTIAGMPFHPAVHWYGIMYLLGFAAAWYLGRSRIRAGRLPGVDSNGFGDLMFYAMLGVVLGGRVGYILFYDLPTYLAHPLQIFKIWEGGMSFHGGLLGVLLAVWWWARKHRLQLFDVVDFIVPLVPPGLGFGRIGNYINGELWGKPTHADWGVVFPGALPQQFAALTPEGLRMSFDNGLLNAFARHPTQLYQAFLEGLVMFAVLWWYSRKPRPRYRMAGLFAVLYGVFRFAVEFVRVPDNDLYVAFGWLTRGQILSVPLILIGLYWLWRSHSAPTLQPQPPPAAAAAANPG